MEPAGETPRQEINTYFVAFGGGVLSVMCGPLFVVSGAVVVAFPDVPARVAFFILAAAAFLVASFDVWRREHRHLATGGVNPFTLARRAALKEKIDALSLIDRKLFDEILIGGSKPVPADDPYRIGSTRSQQHLRSRGRFTRLITLGLIVRIDATNSYIMHPEILGDAKAFYAVRLADRKDVYR